MVLCCTSSPVDVLTGRANWCTHAHSFNGRASMYRAIRVRRKIHNARVYAKPFCGDYCRHCETLDGLMDRDEQIPSTFSKHEICLSPRKIESLFVRSTAANAITSRPSSVRIDTLISACLRRDRSHASDGAAPRERNVGRMVRSRLYGKPSAKAG